MPNVGIVELDVERFGERSVVVKQFGKAPLQVHRPLYIDGAAHPTVYLRSPSSGLLDGDVHRISLNVRDGAALEMRTQAACVVYPGRAEQILNVRVGADAMFRFRPHPFILHKGARLRQRVRIGLEETSRLVFADSWSAGRLAMQEAWEFDEYDNTVEIVLGDKLIYRDRYRIRPAEQPVAQRFICGEYKLFETLHLYGARLDEEVNGEVAWQSTRGACRIIRAMRRA